MTSFIQSLDLLEHRFRRWLRGAPVAADKHSAPANEEPASSASSHELVASPVSTTASITLSPVAPASKSTTSSASAPLEQARKPYVNTDTWGCLGHLTKEQQVALDQIKAAFANTKCKDPGVNFADEHFLLRFLRARKFDVPKTKVMLQGHLEWCNTVLPSTITADDVAAIIPCGLARPGPYTKEGLPIIIIKVENYDPTAFNDIDLFVKYCAFNFYQVAKRLPPGAEKGVLFFDMRGWSLWRHATSHSMKLIGILIKIIQDQNPERLQKAVLFNAPGVFSSTWRLIKMLLDPVVAAKVVFVNDAATVLAMVDKKDLPREYGGDRAEPYPVA